MRRALAILVFATAAGMATFAGAGVIVAGCSLVLALVRGLRNARRGGGAGDVGDRGDVVPVDAVTQSEREAKANEGQKTCKHVSLLCMFLMVER